jgi:hypothetical protein
MSKAKGTLRGAFAPVEPGMEEVMHIRGLRLRNAGISDKLTATGLKRWTSVQ